MKTQQTKRAIGFIEGDRTLRNITQFQHLPGKNCFTAALLAVCLTVILHSAAFGAIACDDSWKGQDGTWSKVTNWTNDLPGKKSYVCLNNGPFVTTLDVAATINGLSIDNHNILSLQNSLDVTGVVDNRSIIIGNGTLNAKTLNNQGTIDAHGKDSLVIKPSGGAPLNVINSGVIEATSGGTLSLAGAIDDRLL